MVLRLSHFCAVFVLFFGLGFAGRTPAVFAATPVSPPTLTPNDTFWGKQWYLRQVFAPGAWAISTGSPKVIVAVIDGGVDISHPDLKQNIWTNEKEIPGDGIDNDKDGFIDDVHGWNFVTRSGDVRPVYGKHQLEETWSHGTMVASLIGARGNDGIGIAGMAWNVRIMPVVVLGADGEGDFDDVVKAVRYAVHHGADIINLSLVGFDENAELNELIRHASEAGVVIVAATGNDEAKEGMNLDQIPAFPVCGDGPHNDVLGVSGTDTLDQKAPYANYGRRCTDLSAPAQELYVARPSYPHGLNPTSSVPGYLGGMTGTSLAAPLVSGVAALIKSVRPLWTSQQIRERIISTSDSIEGNLTDAQKGGIGRGRLNAARALEGLGAGSTEKREIVKSPTSTMLVSEMGGRVQRHVFTFRAEQEGWIEQGSGAPLGYAVLKTRGAHRLWIWDPVTDRVKEVRLSAAKKNVLGSEKLGSGWVFQKGAQAKELEVIGPQGIRGKLLQR